MEPPMYYEPVSVAIEKLRAKGYTHDFNLGEDCIICNTDRFAHDQFEVKEIYRYEGDSDPGDSAVVYGIESNTGLRGVLVSGYGIYTEPTSSSIMEKLNVTRKYQ